MLKQFFRGNRSKETVSSVPAISLTPDGVQAIINCISKLDPVDDQYKVHPGHVVVATERILAVASEHPDRFLNKPIDGITVLSIIPEYGLDLSAEALGAWRDSFKEEYKSS